MKENSFKRKLFLTLLMLLCSMMSVYADNNDGLITQQITIRLDEAGTLPNRISSTKKYKITNLKIIGDINGSDVRLIRDMAGCNWEGKRTDGNLSVLDLSEANIVEGGESYYDGGYRYCVGYSKDAYTTYRGSGVFLPENKCHRRKLSNVKPK